MSTKEEILKKIQENKLTLSNEAKGSAWFIFNKLIKNKDLEALTISINQCIRYATDEKQITVVYESEKAAKTAIPALRKANKGIVFLDEPLTEGFEIFDTATTSGVLLSKYFNGTEWKSKQFEAEQVSVLEDAGIDTTTYLTLRYEDLLDYQDINKAPSILTDPLNSALANSKELKNIIQKTPTTAIFVCNKNGIPQLKKTITACKPVAKEFANEVQELRKQVQADNPGAKELLRNGLGIELIYKLKEEKEENKAILRTVTEIDLSNLGELWLNKTILESIFDAENLKALYEQNNFSLNRPLIIRNEQFLRENPVGGGGRSGREREDRAKNRLKNENPYSAKIKRTTALIQCAREGYLASLNWLLEKSVDLGKIVDLETRDSDGNTALLSAMEMGHVEIVSILLKEGAKSDVCNNYGNNLLSQLLYKKNEETILELLKLLNEKGIEIKHPKDPSITNVTLLIEKAPELVNSLLNNMYSARH